ncbi:MAG: hypothetical protein ACYS80_24835 [Planctomycetota bacterium]|jgi:hypothetical protein
MMPIIDKRYFSNIDLDDLKETQRQITLRIKKIVTTDTKNLDELSKELAYWTKSILYEKSKHLWRSMQASNSKLDKIKTFLES